MRLKNKIVSVPPQRAAGSEIRSSACKLFCPCDGLSNGFLRESKNGIVFAPQAGYAFEHDPARHAVRSTAPQSSPREPLLSGSYPTLDGQKFILFVAAGYLTDLNFIRTSFGHIAPGSVGWGNSDGGTPSAGDGSGGHVLIRDDEGRTNGSTIADTGWTEDANGPTLAGVLAAALGEGAYVVRYSLNIPGPYNTEASARDGVNGVTVAGATNDDSYGGTQWFLGDINMNPLFRTSGMWLTGFGFWQFDSRPSDLELAITSMARWWHDGHKAVWPWN